MMSNLSIILLRMLRMALAKREKHFHKSIYMTIGEVRSLER